MLESALHLWSFDSNLVRRPLSLCFPALCMYEHIILIHITAPNIFLLASDIAKRDSSNRALLACSAAVANPLVLGHWKKSPWKFFDRTSCPQIIESERRIVHRPNHKMS